MYEHQKRYAQTQKGKAARRKAMDNWNAKRRQMRKQRREDDYPKIDIPGPISSIFQLGESIIGLTTTPTEQLSQRT